MKKFLSNTEYLAAVRDAISSAKHIDAAVAFWGARSEALFSDSSVPVRIVCNLLSGGTNPNPVRILRDNDAVQIHNSSSLHAKVLLTDTVAIIGSANFSTNGLHYEGDELDGWLEAGILTDDRDVLEQVAAWFSTLWNSSLPVDESDLLAASAAWESSRTNRAAGPTKKSFAQLRKADLLGRPVHIVLWKFLPSESGEQDFGIAQQEAAVNGINTKELDFYEDWHSLPKDAYLIDVHIDPKGIIKVGNLYIRRPELDPIGSNIQIVSSLSKLQGFPFVYDAAFRDALTQHLKQIYLSLLGDKNNRDLPLSEAIP
ncbi:phospholipase D family protein [Undibacterium seohonense]|uniref:Phospholipase D family protein n=1 Tax=Undibacterium seohonense TaxID=1344950 RepID=A0ABR6X9K2_9BURK|nr:phospholipase D family protein [Undibacterium seohonense]MBC3809615.1 phospholipase D family protein [Undibacterium seohonense]